MMDESKRKYYREYYRENKERILANMKKRYKRNNEDIKEFKRREHYIRRQENMRLWSEIAKKQFGFLKCSKCNYDKCSRAIEFHHVNPEEKTIAISKLFQLKPTDSRIAIFGDESKNLIILCSNCHKELHQCLEDVENAFLKV